MSKPFSTTVDVPTDVEQAFAALTGPSWPAALDAALHDGSTLVEAAATGDGGARLVVSRRLPDGIPGFLAAFVPRDGRVTQTDVWGPATGGTRRGTWQVTFPGSPGEISGENVLEPAAGGTRWSVTGTVRIKVPLVGGRAESFLAPLAGRLVTRQGEVLAGEVGVA